MENIKGLMHKSPVRAKIMEKENIPFKEMIVNKLGQQLEDIKLIEIDNSKPLNIVLVGEVKSGKSTLFNALLGEDISEVDILEATSTIIKAPYSDLVNLVDTPGIKSITGNNEETTMNYIKNADLIIFVIDGTHLGQEDILEALEVIYESQKLTVGVINKGDLINEERESVLDYAKEEYGLYMEEFFMISSNKYKEEGYEKEFEKLVKYINKIEDSSIEVKEASIQLTLESLVHKEIIYHHEYNKSISVIIDELNKYEKLLIKKSEFVEEKMKYEIKNWLSSNFLSHEMIKAKEDTMNAGKYINEPHIQNTIDKKKEELDKVFFESWSECLKEVSNELNEDIKKYIENISYTKEVFESEGISYNNSTSDMNTILATVGTGAMLGITSGGVISLYAATLSQSAASITLGASIMTYCPPLLLAGTLSGALGILIYDKIKQEQKNKEIIQYLDGFYLDLKYSIKEDLNKIYQRLSQDIVYTTLDILKDIKGIYMNKYEMEDLAIENDEYIKLLKAELKK